MRFDRLWAADQAERGAALLTVLIALLATAVILTWMMETAGSEVIGSRASRHAAGELYEVEAALAEYAALIDPIPASWVPPASESYVLSTGAEVVIAPALLARRVAADGSIIREISLIGRTPKGRGRAVAMLVRDSLPVGETVPVRVPLRHGWFEIVR
jgi:hypothetical protein